MPTYNINRRTSTDADAKSKGGDCFAYIYAASQADQALYLRVLNRNSPDNIKSDLQGSFPEVDEDLRKRSRLILTQVSFFPLVASFPSSPLPMSCPFHPISLRPNHHFPSSRSSTVCSPTCSAPATLILFGHK